MKLKHLIKQALSLLLAVMMITTSVPVLAITGTEATVIHNGPNNPTFSHGITAKATIGSASNTTKITSYISAGHVKDQRYSKASDWITVPLDSTQASSINIAVSTWQTNSNGTNISSGGGSNYTNYTDTWSIAVPAY